MHSGSILSALLYGLLPASGFAASHNLHRRHPYPVLGPPGDAVVPVVGAPPPNNGIVDLHPTPPAAPKIVYPGEQGDSSSAPSTTSVARETVHTGYTSSTSTSVYTPSSTSYSSHHAQSTKAPKSKSKSKSESESKTKTESKHKHKISSAPTTFATLHPSSSSAWNVTTTSSSSIQYSPTSTAAASTTSMVFTGGLKDPTLDQPCFNASCHNPSSDMNYRVTINVDNGSSGATAGGGVEHPLQGSATQIGMGRWGFLIAVGVAVVAGL
ncbi:hypothetical protein K440DRAFT_619862 [Wilcoxina mikolae CBS 423.85]|nr:hypothetical protein K440DRAFT_619862 [Wilcoxina mikolae CBS 423.85]